MDGRAFKHSTSARDQISIFCGFGTGVFTFFRSKANFIVLEARNLCFLKFGIVINIPERLFCKNGVSHLILSFDKQDGCSSH